MNSPFAGMDPYIESPELGSDFHNSLAAEIRAQLNQSIHSAGLYRRPVVSVWPIQLADRLPVVPVPLLEADPDVPLDLQAMVNNVYERGAYASQIDYGQPPSPPVLADDEQIWLDSLLSETARR